MHTHDTLIAAYDNAREKTAHDTGRPVPPSRLHHVELDTINRILPAGGSLVDIGTGLGLVPTTFHLLGHSVISTDFPTTGGVQHLNRLMDYGIRGHFLEVGKDPIPEPDDSVDVVFVGNVIEHLPHTPRYFLQDLIRILKPGGHLVVDTKNAVDLKTRLKMLLGVSNWPTLRGIYPIEYNYMHHKEYTLAELVDVLELSGLENVKGLAAEVFFYQSLRAWGTLRAMGARPEERAQFAPGGFNPLHPYEYLRLPLLALCKLFPGLRSDILAVGQKPQ